MIERRRIEAVDYAEYLAEIVKLAREVLHPEENKIYSDSVKDSPAKRAIYDYLNRDEELTLRIDEAIRDSCEPGFRENLQKSRQICKIIDHVLIESGTERDKAKTETEELFEIVKVQPEYDR